MKKYLILAILLSLISIKVEAALFTSSQNGNWNNIATWGFAGIPGPLDDVVIAGHNVTLDINGNCKNLTVNGTLTFGAIVRTLTVNGDLSGVGTINMQNAAHTLDLKGANNSISNFQTNATGSTVSYTGAGVQQVFSSWQYHNITFTGGTKMLQGVVQANNNLNYACEVDLNGQQLIMLGDITGAGSFAGNSTSSIEFQGAGATTGQVRFSAGKEILANFTMNRNAGTVTLGSTLEISNQLTLNNGYIVSSAVNTLTISNTSSGAIGGGSSSSYIRGPLRRILPANGNNWEIYNFPVGKSTYNLFRIYSPYITAAANIQIEVFDANCGGTTDNLRISSLNANRYWKTDVISGTFKSANYELYENGAFINNQSQIGHSNTTANGLYHGIESDYFGDHLSSYSKHNEIQGFFALGQAPVNSADIVDTKIGSLSELPSPLILKIGQGVYVDVFRDNLRAAKGATFVIQEWTGVWTTVAAPATTLLTSTMRIHVTSQNGLVTKDYAINIATPLTCPITQYEVDATDGNISAAWANYFPTTADEIPILNQSINSGFTTTNFSASFNLLTDSENLYILVRVTDDVPLVAYDGPSGNPFLDDCIEIFTDANNTKAATFHTGATINARQFLIRYGETPKFLHKGINNASDPALVGIEYEIINQTGGYAVEIMVPWASLGFAGGTTTPGQLFGFDIAVDDDDDGGYRDQQLTWYDEHQPDVAWQLPACYATAEAVAYLPDISFNTFAIAPLTVDAGDNVTLTGNVHCGSASSILANFDIDYYYSADNTLDAADILISSQTITAPLARNTDFALSPVLTIPTGISVGNAYIIAVADAVNVITEFDETNNEYPSPVFTISLPDTCYWNGIGIWSEVAKWTPTAPNAAASAVIQTGIVTVQQNVNIKDLIIRPKASLTIDAGWNLSTSNIFLLKSDKTGAGSFINNGSVSFTNGKFQRHLRGFGTYSNYHLISSPVKSEPYTTFNEFLYWFDETEPSYYMSMGWTLKDNGMLMPGWGYMASVYNDTIVNFTAANETELNSGTVTIPITYTYKDAQALYEGWNLIGNPFTAALDWDLVWPLNPNVENQIHYWNLYKYASYVSGVSINVGVGGNGQNIPANQAFFIKTLPSALVFNFPYSACVHEHGNNQDGFWKKEKKSEIIRLEIKTKGYTDETVIRYNENALNQHDSLDANKLFSGYTSFGEIFTYNAAQTPLTPLVVNTIPISHNTDTLSLGLKNPGSSKPVITLTELTCSNIDKCYLLDVLNGNIYNLELNVPVSPTYSKYFGDITNQFKIIITKSPVTKLNSNSSLKPYLLNICKNSIEIIQTDNIEINTIKLYDISGRNIGFANEKMLTAKFTNLKSGIYILKIESSQKIFTEKIIIP